MARTLHAPRTPDHKRPGNCGLWDRITTGPYRPSDDYAQPSLRYMNLLRAGAKEHNLPQVYKDYLESIQPYTPTHLGQKIGKFTFILAFGPMFLLMMRISSFFADESGKTPKFMSTIMTMLSNVMWIGYDNILKPIFGNGERTEGKEDTEKESAKRPGEKASLLNGRS
ncbi:hypothetical protein NLG97_g8130 [Lecanicillium saksenae]|uniref:Uncharacterized protein n=1 Tax=Lecanicillium saksenae TaxID=468837 RepID=A0ACC1QME2_9HYPO|nr:hypothetical protein NLG97_g8130 [Lecanicillium saksenae]